MRRKFGDLLYKRHLASFNLAILLHFAVSTVVMKGLKGFKFGGFFQNHQFAKLKHSPIFPAIRYIVVSLQVHIVFIT